MLAREDFEQRGLPRTIRADETRDPMTRKFKGQRLQQRSARDFESDGVERHAGRRHVLAPRRLSNIMRNGAPMIAATKPVGSCKGKATVRAAKSARAMRPAPAAAALSSDAKGRRMPSVSTM